jgi:DNA recombination protein RmuC
MQAKLGQVEQLISEFETARESKLGALGQQLENVSHTLGLLQQALGNTRSRGQWGERIADDILRISGFVEGINYTKQTSTNSGSRPDFTFLLPNGLNLNMDSKFPLDNYLRFLQATAESDRERHRKQFLKDVRDRVKEITQRAYINTEQNTVDIALMFIPNEQVYRFIHENDDTIIDEALKSRIVICSPLTLYIVLAVIQQATRNFALEQSSREILLLMNDIKKQWGLFTEQMTRLGDHLDKASEAYQSLLETRKRQLDKPFRNLDDLLIYTD